MQVKLKTIGQVLQMTTVVDLGDRIAGPDDTWLLKSVFEEHGGKLVSVEAEENDTEYSWRLIALRPGDLHWLLADWMIVSGGSIKRNLPSWF